MNSIEEAPLAEASTALFFGDTGELPLDTRRVLVHLLTGPAIEAKRQRHLWPIVLRDEVILRSRLAELFLELMIDKELEVAFTRQADTGEVEVPSLLRRTQLTFIDSVLLLFLRQRLMQSDAQAEKAAISTQEMIEQLILYERHANTDRAGFTKRVMASIEKFKKYSILRKIRGNEGRFEISPTLKILFSVEEILTLNQSYQTLLAPHSPEKGSIS